MVTNSARRRTLKLVAAIGLGVALSGCSTGSFISQKTEGYVIPDAALQQIRPGQSADLVVAVLGSPQSRNSFGDERAFYYIETKVERTAFGLRIPKERRVLAVYFDDKSKVTSKVLYGLEDGHVINMDTRRTPSYGADRTFVQSIMSSF